MTMLMKILPYIITAIIAVLIFIAGFATGTHFFARMKSTTMLQDAFLNSSPLNTSLSHLDKGEIDKARQLLLLHQDSSILTINLLAEDADKESYITACNMLKRIAKHRKDNPSIYSNYAYGIEEQKMSDINKEIGVILDKWQTTPCDKSNQ